MNQTEKINELINVSKAQGIPVTEQRLAVYCALLSSEKHPSPEEIYHDLKSSYPTLSLATVYKNLEALAKLGFAHKVNPITDHLRYDANLKPHSHFICLSCRRVEDVYFDEETWNRMPKFPHRNYKIMESSMQYFGICNKCHIETKEER